MKLKVFLSWSGGESRRAAAALKPWLQGLIPKVDAWMSERDIDAGSPWAVSLHDRLRTSELGILLITGENLTSPWMLYEAGALAISTRPGCVVPYLLGVVPDQLSGPFGCLQSVSGDRGGMWRIVSKLVDLLGIQPEKALVDAFDREWPSLAKQLGLSIDLKADPVRGVTIVRLTNAQLMDNIEMDAFVERMKSCSGPSVKNLVLDLGDATTMPSSGIGALIRLMSRIHRAGGQVVFAGLSATILEAIKIWRLEALVRHFPTVDDALEFLKLRP